MFTFFVIPNLLANATIWGIGELANVFVLASTGLKLTFLLLVVIDWLFSVLQNHLLNFFTGNTILCNVFLICYAAVPLVYSSVPPLVPRNTP